MSRKSYPDLTAKQRFICSTEEKVAEKVEKILRRDMEKYRKRFGFDSEDVWLWMACGISYEVVLNASMTRNRHKDEKTRRKSK
jgi:hypothetical protein